MTEEISQIKISKTNKEEPVRKYNLFHAIFMSFFSKDFYRDVARNWYGLSIVFLLILVLITGIPLLLEMNAGINQFVQQSSTQVVQQMPRVTIKNGRLSTPQNRPYLITMEADGEQEKIIIDTTGKYTSIEQTGARILVTSTQVYMKKNDNETRVYTLENVENLEFGQEDVTYWINLFAKWFMIFFAPFMLAGIFLFRFMQVLLYTVFGLLMKAVLNSKLNYGALLSLTAMSLAPVILINFILDISGSGVSLPWYVNFLIAMGYLFFGIKSEKDVTGDPAEPGNLPDRAYGE